MMAQTKEAICTRVTGWLWAIVEGRCATIFCYSGVVHPFYVSDDRLDEEATRRLRRKPPG